MRQHRRYRRSTGLVDCEAVDAPRTRCALECRLRTLRIVLAVPTLITEILCGDVRVAHLSATGVGAVGPVSAGLARHEVAVGCRAGEDVMVQRIGGNECAQLVDDQIAGNAAVQRRQVCGHHDALVIVPGAGADSISRVDNRIVGREVGAPGATPCAGRIRQAFALRVGSTQPTEVASVGAVARARHEEAHDRIGCGVRAIGIRVGGARIRVEGVGTTAISTPIITTSRCHD